MNVINRPGLNRLFTAGGIASMMLIPGASGMAAGQQPDVSTETAIAKGLVVAANSDSKALTQQEIDIE